MLTLILALLIGIAPAGPVEPVDVPSGIAGLTVSQLEDDAVRTVRTLGEPGRNGSHVFLREHAASYGTYPPAYPDDYFVMQSVSTPGVFHVFHVVAARLA
jgi:hypothetical protein